ASDPDSDPNGDPQSEQDEVDGDDLNSPEAQQYLDESYAEYRDTALGPTWLMLESDRISPLQWVTTNFLHADLGHLLGNMIFLWTFGLIVEGKIGWGRFLAVYAIIGIVYAAIIQFGMFLLMDRYQVVLGASAVIFGLMAICVVWAPRNEVSVFVWLFRPRMIEIPLMVLGFAYLAMQILMASVQSFSLSSEVLHLVGAGVGFPIGFWMLKREWVDCEGWDLLSVLAGNEGGLQHDAAATTRKAIQVEQRQTDQQRAMIVHSLMAAIEAGNSTVALSMFEKQQRHFSARHPFPAELLRRLIRLLQQEEKWEASLPVMQKLVDDSPQPDPGLRLKMAQILLQVSRKPSRCLKELAKLPAELTEKQQQLRDRLRRAARQAIADDDDEIQLADE
ncbi:MAG: rhomboid family intramembrane serine protease, partial [Planctomycetales bacterium]|nr:rhomboid family intramembrane serine protease [Planctomycetales bacterium]